MIKKASDTLIDFEYYIKGKNPKLLIHSGTHGDEFEVIDLVKEAIVKYEDLLPDFLFVPYVSPSAVKHKIRFNSSGLDTNRIFFADTDEIEVMENIKILKHHTFDLFVSFHEDPESEEYYIYDSGLDKIDNIFVKQHNFFLRSNGIKLLNGLDDVNDPSLGYEFKDGYRKFIETNGMTNNGMTTVWAISEGIAKNCLVPEIPGLLDIKQKELIVDSFFLNVLCNFRNSSGILH